MIECGLDELERDRPVAPLPETQQRAPAAAAPRKRGATRIYSRAAAKQKGP